MKIFTNEWKKNMTNTYDCNKRMSEFEMHLKSADFLKDKFWLSLSCSERVIMYGRGDLERRWNSTILQ